MDNLAEPLRVSFIKFKAPQLLDTFLVSAQYDSELDRFVIPHENRQEGVQLRVDLQDLQAAIDEFRNSFPDSTLKLDAEKCSWEDVFHQLEETTTHHEATGNGGGIEYLHRLWRKAGRNADEIDPWLDFIPDEYGLNFVRAGIVVILQLAKRSVQDRATVHEAIDQVVGAVTRASPKRRIFSWDEALRECIHNLYVAVLEAVSVIIQYLLQRIKEPRSSKNAVLSRAKGVGQATKKPKSPKRSINDIDRVVTNVQSNANRFGVLCDNLRDEINIDSYSLQLESRERLRHLSLHTERNTVINAHMRDAMDDHLPVIKGQTEWIKDELSQLRDDVRAHRDELQAREKKFKEWARDLWARELMNHTNELLRYQERRREQELDRICDSLTSFAPGIPGSRTPIPLVSSQVLLDILRVPISAPNKDLDMVMMERSWFNEQTLTVAEELFKAPPFGQWLASEFSGLLLVDGHDEKHATETISSMSLVCLGLIGSISSAHREREVVAYFFCGLHCDPREGPRLMMRSLITQLLLALQVRRLLDLSFINNEVYLRDLQHADPRALVLVLQGLVRLFPVDVTVYCVIDGVQWFEGGYPGFFTEDMLYFIDKIRGLAQPQLNDPYYGNSLVRCRFKVLLASANGTDACWERVIGRSERVSLNSAF